MHQTTIEKLNSLEFKNSLTQLIQILAELDFNSREVVLASLDILCQRAIAILQMLTSEADSQEIAEKLNLHNEVTKQYLYALKKHGLIYSYKGAKNGHTRIFYYKEKKNGYSL